MRVVCGSCPLANKINFYRFTGLLLEQERARMVVSMDEPVAAKVMEQASSLPKPVWPDVPLLLFGFGALGLFLGYVVFGVCRASSDE